MFDARMSAHDLVQHAVVLVVNDGHELLAGTDDWCSHWRINVRQCCCGIYVILILFYNCLRLRMLDFCVFKVLLLLVHTYYASVVLLIQQLLISNFDFWLPQRLFNSNLTFDRINFSFALVIAWLVMHRKIRIVCALIYECFRFLGWFRLCTTQITKFTLYVTVLNTFILGLILNFLLWAFDFYRTILKTFASCANLIVHTFIQARLKFYFFIDYFSFNDFCFLRLYNVCCHFSICCVLKLTVSVLSLVLFIIANYRFAVVVLCRQYGFKNIALNFNCFEQFIVWPLLCHILFELAIFTHKIFTHSFLHYWHLQNFLARRSLLRLQLKHSLYQLSHIHWKVSRDSWVLPSEHLLK